MSLHGGGLSADNYDVGPPDLFDGERSARSARHARPSGLLRNGPFLRLWLAQIVSNLGDWAYVLAVEIAFATSLEPNALVRATAIFLGVEGLTSAAVGLTIAGPVVDRFPRRRVMVVADIARCAAVATLIFVHDPSWLHVVGVAATLGAFRSVFHPAMMASVRSWWTGSRSSSPTVCSRARSTSRSWWAPRSEPRSWSRSVRRARSC